MQRKGERPMNIKKMVCARCNRRPGGVARAVRLLVGRRAGLRREGRQGGRQRVRLHAGQRRQADGGGFARLPAVREPQRRQARGLRGGAHEPSGRGDGPRDASTCRPRSSTPSFRSSRPAARPMWVFRASPSPTSACDQVDFTDAVLRREPEHHRAQGFGHHRRGPARGQEGGRPDRHDRLRVGCREHQGRRDGRLRRDDRRVRWRCSPARSMPLPWTCRWRTTT